MIPKYVWGIGGGSGVYTDACKTTTTVIKAFNFLFVYLHCHFVIQCQVVMHCHFVMHCRFVIQCQVVMPCQVVIHCQVVMHCHFVMPCQVVMHCQVVMPCQVVIHCQLVLHYLKYYKLLKIIFELKVIAFTTPSTQFKQAFLACKINIIMTL